MLPFASASIGEGSLIGRQLKWNDPRCGSTCTRVAGSDWANWCRMLIICAAIEIARRGHSTTALSMGSYILARRSRYLFYGVCRSSLNFRALRPSTFISCCPLGLCRFHVVARMWPLHLSECGQKSDVHFANVFCVVIVKNVLCLAQVVFSYVVLHSSKIPLVLTTKVTHLRSLLFKQPDGVNCVVRRVYSNHC